MSKRDSFLKALSEGPKFDPSKPFSAPDFIAQRQQQELTRGINDAQWLRERGIVAGQQPGARMFGPESYTVGSTEPTVLGPAKRTTENWRSMPWYQRLGQALAGTPKAQEKQGEFFKDLPEYYAREYQRMMPMGDIPIRDKHGKVVKRVPREEWERMVSPLDPTEQAAADPLLGVLDMLVPGPGGEVSALKKGLITTPSMHLPGSAIRQHPADLRKALKWGEAPRHLERKAESYYKLADKMRSAGMDAPSMQTSQLADELLDVGSFLDVIPAGKRHLAMGDSAKAQALRKTYRDKALQSGMEPYQVAVALTRLNETSSEKTLSLVMDTLREGTTRKMRRIKGDPGKGYGKQVGNKLLESMSGTEAETSRQLRQSAQYSAEEMKQLPVGHPLRQGYLTGPANPKGMTSLYAGGRPGLKASFEEAGYAPAVASVQASTYPLGTVGMRTPHKKIADIQTLWLDDPADAKVALHELIHGRGKTKEMQEFMSKYANDVLKRDIPNTPIFGQAQRLHPDIRGGAIKKTAAGIEPAGSYSDAPDWALLEESFTWDLEEYFSGGLQNRVANALQKGDVKNRDVHAFLWLHENVPIKNPVGSRVSEADLYEGAQRALPLGRGAEHDIESAFTGLKQLSPEELRSRGMGAGELTPSTEPFTNRQLNDWEEYNQTLAQKMQRRR